jgi:hypothetical protein
VTTRPTRIISIVRSLQLPCATFYGVHVCQGGCLAGRVNQPPGWTLAVLVLWSVPKALLCMEVLV